MNPSSGIRGIEGERDCGHLQLLIHISGST